MSKDADKIKKLESRKDHQKVLSLLSEKKQSGEKITDKKSIISYLRSRGRLCFVNALGRFTQENVTTWLWRNDLL